MSESRKNKTGDVGGLEYPPWIIEKMERVKSRTDAKNAEKSGPVKTRKMTPEERKRYGLD